MRYFELLQKLQSLGKEYKVNVIGKTEFNRDIIAVERTLNQSFYTAILLSGIHARENISSDVVFEMIRQNLFDKITDFNLSFILIANPDGVELQSGAIGSFSKEIQKSLIQINGNSEDFSMWKANARGVDINNNFDARYKTNVHANFPSSQGYIGEFAESEMETQAIVSYTKKKNPFITISYHTKGEEIYFNFFQDEKRLKRDESIALQFAKSTGYRIVNVENSSSGGYKDWCVEKLKIPALTIELGNDSLTHPIAREHIKEIFDKNKKIASDLQFAYNEFIKSR